MTAWDSTSAIKLLCNTNYFITYLAYLLCFTFLAKEFFLPSLFFSSSSNLVITHYRHSSLVDYYPKWEKGKIVPSNSIGYRLIQLWVDWILRTKKCCAFMDIISSKKPQSWSCFEGQTFSINVGQIKNIWWDSFPLFSLGINNQRGTCV